MLVRWHIIFTLSDDKKTARVLTHDTRRGRWALTRGHSLHPDLVGTERGENIVGTEFKGDNRYEAPVLVQGYLRFSDSGEISR